MAYTAPTPDQFRARYPAFAALDNAAIQVWLDEGETETATWADDTRARAVMLYAAHKLAEGGQGTGNIAAGVTSFKSGTFSATITDAAASRTGFYATVYGREYLDLMRRNFGGPRLAWQPPAYV
ncbi:MAG: DUF4054 domain-containing protein [Blastomonas sp.]